MRDANTDAFGIQLDKAFVKSGLSVAEFIKHCVATRQGKVFDYSSQGFHVLVEMDDGYNIIQCYYNTRWWCKV